MSSRDTLFPDADLLAYVTEMYGPVMAAHVESIFAEDGQNTSGFGQSVRRSLTRELDRLVKVPRPPGV